MCSFNYEYDAITTTCLQHGPANHIRVVTVEFQECLDPWRCRTVLNNLAFRGKGFSRLIISRFDILKVGWWWVVVVFLSFSTHFHAKGLICHRGMSPSNGPESLAYMLIPCVSRERMTPKQIALTARCHCSRSPVECHRSMSSVTNICATQVSTIGTVLDRLTMC